jgi:hypothetical protein
MLQAPAADRLAAVEQEQLPHRLGARRHDNGLGGAVIAAHHDAHFRHSRLPIHED